MLQAVFFLKKSQNRLTDYPRKKKGRPGHRITISKHISVEKRNELWCGVKYLKKWTVKRGDKRDCE